MLYKYANGRVVQFDTYDEHTLHKISCLPIDGRIHLLGIPLEEMQKFIDNKKKTYKNFLIELIGKKWLWRMDSEPAVIMEIPGIGYSPEVLLKKLKSRTGISIELMNKAIEFYTGENSELFIVEN